jgi:hypothetical protein
MAPWSSKRRNDLTPAPSSTPETTSVPTVEVTSDRTVLPRKLFDAVDDFRQDDILVAYVVIQHSKVNLLISRF